MSYVGIVLVSHSAELAEGLKKLLKQVAAPCPRRGRRRRKRR